MGAGRGRRPSVHPPRAGTGHQLLRYRRHVFGGRERGNSGPRAEGFRPPRDRVVIATKVFNPMGDDPNQRGLSRKHILHAIDDSLRRLRTDYVDLYQIHRFDYETPIEETLEALDDVVRAGKALYIGASSMFAWQFAKMLYTADELGLARFVSMQNHYNLVYREEEREMMPLCRARGHRRDSVEPAGARFPDRQSPPAGFRRDHARQDRRLRAEDVLSAVRFQRGGARQRDRPQARRAECAGRAGLAARSSPA